MQAVKKAEQAGALSGEMLGRSLRETLGFHVLEGREALRNEEARGEWGKGTIFPSGERTESLESQKAHESRWPRPELKPRVRRGAQLLGWE